LRLGIGVGWNHVEYQSLGAEWHTRGVRQAEQIEVMRRLWTEDLVTFNGRFHDLQSVNIVPPPIQRPIPIWFGGSSDAVTKRAARLGDGWMPIMARDEQGEAKLEEVRGHLKAFGRDPATFGIEGWVRMTEPNPDGWAEAVAGWRRLGADMVMHYPMYRLPTFDQQIETLRRFKDAAGAA
jgi:alkanesulfonate monooxygenase SsuD/methylene tetrahydromethanopterin reductase-like flavin-dependent oxidoreductase (luciferase family)